MPYLPHKTCCPDHVASPAAIPDEANCSWLHQSHHCGYMFPWTEKHFIWHWMVMAIDQVMTWSATLDYMDMDWAIVRKHNVSPHWLRPYEAMKNSIMSACALRWRHDGRVVVSNHQPRDCSLKRPFRRRSKLRDTGLCAGNSPMTGEFPAQMASHAENVSIWWRHHGLFTVNDILRTSSGVIHNKIASSKRKLGCAAAMLSFYRVSSIKRKHCWRTP